MSLCQERYHPSPRRQWTNGTSGSLPVAVSAVQHAVEEAYLGQDTCAEKGQQGDNRDDSHVTHNPLKLLRKTPQRDRDSTNDQDIVVGRRKRVGILSHLGYLEIALPSIVDVEEGPDSNDRGCRDGNGDGEP